MRLTHHFILLCLLCGLLARSAFARPDELHLKDGRVIEAEEVWEMGEALWYRQGKVITAVAKADVLRVARPKSASLPEATPPPAAVGQDAKASKPKPRAAARIVLKGGTQIDADAVWEETTRVGYRLGSMQTFIDREAVARVVRDAAPGEQPTPPRPSVRFTTGHAGLDQLIARSGARHGVDPLLLYLVMRQESGFNHRAVSRAGARGLMQLMPATARRLGVRNIHDPVENVEAGTRYLRNLLELFAGDVNLALAAYNAGEDAVVRYGRRVPPYRETQHYVRRINAAYRRALGSEALAAASKQPEPLGR